MATRIIKEGQQKFIVTCPRCGCEFEYELEDISVRDIVHCPCCYHACIHKNFANDNRGIKVYPNMIPCKQTTETIPQDIKIWYTSDTSDPCENCDWHKQMLLRKEPYVGDSPCQWCLHSPYKVTCDSNSKLV